MYCADCPKKPTCTKLCKEVESYLKKQGIYSADYIRPQMPSHKRKRGNRWREIPLSTWGKPEAIEEILGRDGFKS